MKRFAILLCGGLGLLLLSQGTQADGPHSYGGQQPWWNIFAKRTKLNPEEERLQRFWHDYYDSMGRYYKTLDRMDWVAYYKNHGYQINTGGGAGCYCGPGGGPNQSHIQFAPVFVSPTMQWMVPERNLSGAPSGPQNPGPGVYTGNYGGYGPPSYPPPGPNPYNVGPMGPGGPGFGPGGPGFGPGGPGFGPGGPGFGPGGPGFGPGGPGFGPGPGPMGMGPGGPGFGPGGPGFGPGPGGPGFGPGGPGFGPGPGPMGMGPGGPGFGPGGPGFGPGPGPGGPGFGPGPGGPGFGPPGPTGFNNNFGGYQGNGFGGPVIQAAFNQDFNNGFHGYHDPAYNQGYYAFPDWCDQGMPMSPVCYDHGPAVNPAFNNGIDGNDFRGCRGDLDPLNMVCYDWGR